jgi:hypothetical protein
MALGSCLFTTLRTSVAEQSAEFHRSTHAAPNSLLLCSCSAAWDSTVDNTLRVGSFSITLCSCLCIVSYCSLYWAIGIWPKSITGTRPCLVKRRRDPPSPSTRSSALVLPKPKYVHRPWWTREPFPSRNLVILTVVWSERVRPCNHPLGRRGLIDSMPLDEIDLGEVFNRSLIASLSHGSSSRSVVRSE